MKNTVIKFGIRALLTGAVLFLMALLLGENLNSSTQMIIGYAAMVVSLIFVYFGIKHFRDNENKGSISFTKALSIGILISFFAAFGFGIIDYLYTSVINPNWAAEYLTKSLASMEASLSPEVYKTESEALIQQMKDYGSSGIGATFMFIQVIVIGFMISLISSLILQRK